jgi:transcriptional regulator NrdR family protein
MICVKCHNPSTTVTNSRPHKKTSSIWRRRNCNNCGYTFTTEEHPKIELTVIVNGFDTPSSSYSLSKLSVSLARAFTHDIDLGARSALDLATTITTTISSEHNSPTITPTEIARYAHIILERFDQRAGLQYGLAHHIVAPPSRKR